MLKKERKKLVERERFQMQEIPKAWKAGRWPLPGSAVSLPGTLHPVPCSPATLSVCLPFPEMHRALSVDSGLSHMLFPLFGMLFPRLDSFYPSRLRFNEWLSHRGLPWCIPQPTLSLPRYPHTLCFSITELNPVYNSVYLCVSWLNIVFLPRM